MKIRIALWASMGFLVAAGWGFYFAAADKAYPVGPMVNGLVRLTEPVIAVTTWLFDFPRGLSWTVVINAGVYGLVGFIVEMIRRRRRIELSNENYGAYR